VSELKVLLGAVVGPAYLIVLLASLMLFKFRPVHASSFFIWGCSMPLTVISYLFWIYESGGDLWSLPVFVIELLALAQIGWLGGLLALLGHIGRWRTLKRSGLAISIFSVAGNGFFLGLIMMFGFGSS
jgi:hypothetical protein